MEQDGAAAARRRSYRKGPERRAQIIARAIESFAVQGVGASLRAIGDSTGVSHAAPWYYFATRDDLPPEVYRAHEAGGDAKPTPEEESRCREAFLPGHRLPAMRISSSRVAPAGQRRWSALGRDACSPPACLRRSRSCQVRWPPTRRSRLVGSLVTGGKWFVAALRTATNRCIRPPRPFWLLRPRCGSTPDLWGGRSPSFTKPLVNSSLTISSVDSARQTSSGGTPVMARVRPTGRWLTPTAATRASGDSALALHPGKAFMSHRETITVRCPDRSSSEAAVRREVVRSFAGHTLVGADPVPERIPAGTLPDRTEAHPPRPRNPV